MGGLVGLAGVGPDVPPVVHDVVLGQLADERQPLPLRAVQPDLDRVTAADQRQWSARRAALRQLRQAQASGLHDRAGQPGDRRAGSIGEQLYQAKILLSSADLFAWTVVIVLVASLFERVVVSGLSLLERRVSAGMSGGVDAAVAP